MPLRQISFHILHAEPVLAAGLHALLDGQSGLRPGPLAGANVLLTDYDHALRQAGHVAARILLLTQRDSECALRRALDGGVHGYLLQSCSADVKGVLSKLDATARTHAVVVAAQRGLIAVCPPDSRPALGGSAGA
ncbi:hypothetical protein [Pseudoduganella violacea]|uniref:DNA-binding response regulator n=1 Tax=Pseudoduganella violacea TaxID=1715466 RepID=A0A7W5BB82_9BURK|nr:hypothetical protein [Pseudoduganella violacea]MBB3119954.1 hypothetical protein [Pseudoduganella violacea]